MNAWLALSIGIGAEVIATGWLAQTQGLTRLWPTLGCIAGYAISLRFVSLAVLGIPTGIAYAIWSGIGIVLVSSIGFFAHKQSLDMPALIGIAMIIGGVVCIRLFSNSQ